MEKSVVLSGPLPCWSLTRPADSHAAVPGAEGELAQCSSKSSMDGSVFGGSSLPVDPGVDRIAQVQQLNPDDIEVFYRSYISGPRLLQDLRFVDPSANTEALQQCDGSAPDPTSLPLSTPSLFAADLPTESAADTSAPSPVSGAVTNGVAVPPGVHSSGTTAGTGRLDSDVQDPMIFEAQQGRYKSESAVRLRTEMGQHSSGIQSLLGECKKRPVASLQQMHDGAVDHGSAEYPTSSFTTYRGLSGVSLSSSKQRAYDQTATRKRKHRSPVHGAHDQEEKDGSEDSDYSVSKRLRHGPDEVIPRFACPFYRSNPTTYQGCLKFTLKRIRDVKQHLQRHHKPPLYCPICFEEFSSGLARDDHIRSRLCTRQSPTTPKFFGGVSEGAQDLLKHRVSRTLSPVDQWYEVWDILFGKHTRRPAKPFLGSMVEETMGMVRDFWKAEGHEIVPAFLEARSTYKCNTSNLESLMMELFDEVQKQFEQSVCSNAPENPDTARSGPKRFSPVNPRASEASLEREEAAGSWRSSTGGDASPELGGEWTRPSGLSMIPGSGDLRVACSPVVDWAPNNTDVDKIYPRQLEYIQGDLGEYLGGFDANEPGFHNGIASWCASPADSQGQSAFCGGVLEL